jgi:hypothetical protein
MYYNTNLISQQLKFSLKLNTLYNPKKPSSLITVIALNFCVDAISPATCKRIFTISNGLVNITCENPAYNQH